MEWPSCDSMCARACLLQNTHAHFEHTEIGNPPFRPSSQQVSQRVGSLSFTDTRRDLDLTTSRRSPTAPVVGRALSVRQSGHRTRTASLLADEDADTAKRSVHIRQNECRQGSKRGSVNACRQTTQVDGSARRASVE